MIRSRIRLLIVNGLFTAAAILKLPVCFAEDVACLQWEVGGEWNIVQSDGTVSTLKLLQNGAQFHGSAYYDYRRNVEHAIGIDDSERVASNGPVVGTVIGSAFDATVYWANNTIGVYTGQVGPQGLIVGSTYDRNNPANHAD